MSLRPLFSLFVLSFALLGTQEVMSSEINEAATAVDLVAEKRLQALAAELRCLVCQNQTIADSNAELAQDLRREVRKLIQAGQSDQQIIDFMVNRYGDFVLYRPPVKGTTALLWAGPGVLLLLALIGLRAYLQRRNARIQAQPAFSAEALVRANVLLKSKESKLP